MKRTHETWLWFLALCGIAVMTVVMGSDITKARMQKGNQKGHTLITTNPPPWVIQIQYTNGRFFAQLQEK